MKTSFNWIAPLVVFLAILAIASASRPRATGPAPLARSRGGAISVQDCDQCHQEIVASLRDAPHSQTLRPASDGSLSAHFAGRQLQVGSMSFRFDKQGNDLFFHSSEREQPIRVDWLFGSGHHALTPVTVLEGVNGETELIQLHVSWFANDRLGVTPGSEDMVEGSTSFGIHHRPAETRECFTCHASHVPMDGDHIKFEKMQAGVLCSRCHQESGTHGKSGGTVSTKPAWPKLTARELIRRCGECHRRADQFTADELRTDNQLLIRFAPVGTELSACFRANEDPRFQGRLPRFDCLTCHDPHQPASRDPNDYVSRCATCHDSQQVHLKRCPVEPDGKRCLECHMPPVEVLKNLSFTDHWVRIRKEAEGDEKTK